MLLNTNTCSILLTYYYRRASVYISFSSNWKHCLLKEALSSFQEFIAFGDLPISLFRHVYHKFHAHT